MLTIKEWQGCVFIMSFSLCATRQRQLLVCISMPVVALQIYFLLLLCYFHHECSSARADSFTLPTKRNQKQVVSIVRIPDTNLGSRSGIAFSVKLFNKHFFFFYTSQLRSKETGRMGRRENLNPGWHTEVHGIRSGLHPIQRCSVITSVKPRRNQVNICICIIIKSS